MSDVAITNEGTAKRAVVHGKLGLDFSNVAGRTQLTVTEQRPPLQVVRAFESNGASLVHLQNVSGGILGGDRLETSVTVGEGARVQVTTTGSSRLYRLQCGAADSIQTVDAKVGAGGIIEWLPDSTIPFAGSRSRISTSISLADDAGLFWWEILAPGRVAHNEVFAYDSLAVDFSVTASGKPIAVECYCIEPGKRDAENPLRFGEFRYLATFYICRVGLKASSWLDLEDALRTVAIAASKRTGDYWGASTLPSHGVVVKGLCRSAIKIHETLVEFWRIAKLALYNENIVIPRKVY